MTRTAVACDRFATLVLGLLLITVGVGALLWKSGWLPRSPETITVPGPVYAADASWWPWATTLGGIALVVLGLLWLSRHRPRARVKELTLRESSATEGRLTANLGSLADATATMLRTHPPVYAARGKAVVDRGTPTLQLDATALSAHHFGDVVAAADDVAATAVGMLGEDIAVSTRLHVDRRRRGKRQLESGRPTVATPDEHDAVGASSDLA